MRVSELARITGLDRAVTKRCVYTLMQLGIVEARGKKYALSSGVLSLGHAYFSSSEIVIKSQICLDELGSEINNNLSLVIMNGMELVYLSRYQSKRLTGTNIGMGTRLPMYCTSVGRALLSSLSDEELHEYLEATDLQHYTERTVTKKSRLKEIIKETRGKGFCIVDQELETGLIGIGMPIKISGIEAPLALNITADVKRTPASNIEELYLGKLRELAEKLSLL